MKDLLVDDGKIICLIHKISRKATPEEFVRQEFCRVLLNVYKYPLSHISLEFPIQMGSKTKRGDIVIFNSSEKTQNNIYIVVETKNKQEIDGKEQLQSYMNATTALFGIWTNSVGISYYLKQMETHIEIIEIPDIPKYRDTLEKVGIYAKDDLELCTNLKDIFVRCNNYFYVNQGLTQDKRFSEIIKILFCKIEDEKNFTKNLCDFFISPKEISGESELQLFRKRIDKLFENVKKRYKLDNIFNETDEIILNDRCLTFAIAAFQKYSLLESDTDIKGIAFETFVGNNLRGEHGEFFTPRELVRLTVELLRPTITETVCDPACGSGGFLVMILKFMRNEIDKIVATKKISAVKLFQDYADDHIRGIDFNPDLARVAKMNMVLNDDGHTGIFHADSLLPFDEWEPKLLDKISKNSMDIIVTNPPFGKKCIIDNKKILRKFELGHKWIKNDLIWEKSELVENYRTPDILFIERCYELLTSTGRMGIVLPDGILGNDGFVAVRQFILDHFHIVAIIDCPVETFLPTVDTKTSLLILKKKEKDEVQTFDTFMGICKFMGHDRRGKILYERNEDGEILFKDGNPLIKNDFFEISERFKEYVESRNIF